MSPGVDEGLKAVRLSERRARRRPNHTPQPARESHGCRYDKRDRRQWDGVGGGQADTTNDVVSPLTREGRGASRKRGAVAGPGEATVRISRCRNLREDGWKEGRPAWAGGKVVRGGGWGAL